jgi:predicted RND superfamily exporter protein
MENNDLILQELKTITKTLKEHTEHFKSIDKQLKVMDKRLSNIEAVVNKGVYEDITRLEKRIEILEEKQAI